MGDQVEATDKELLIALSSKTYKEQAVWFLNAYWEKDLDLGNKEEEREKIWNYYSTCVELDKEKQEEGNELDEFQAHRLLEKIDKALTVKKMREVFREIDLDFNKRVSLTEFLIYKYGIDFKYLVRAPQASGEVARELEAAEMKVAAAQAAIEVCKEREAEAKKSLQLQKEAEKEVKEALEAIKREEEAFENEKNTLTQQSEDESLGIVKRQKAKNMLLQLLAGDPTPLKTAKITQEAAVRKQERATKAAVEARERAERAREESEKKYQEAKELLEEIKAKAGAGQGAVWWMLRELEESKKYMSNKQRQKVEREQIAKEEKLKQELGL